MRWSLLGLVCLVMTLGCAERAWLDCPSGLDVNTSNMDQEIRATYTAEQAKGRVTIRATGELPSGYEAVFVQSPLKIYPPQFTLMRHKLNGIYPAVQKPFDACVAFKATGPVPQVTVRDADGPHEVKVAG